MDYSQASTSGSDPAQQTTLNTQGPDSEILAWLQTNLNVIKVPAVSAMLQYIANQLSGETSPQMSPPLPSSSPPPMQVPIDAVWGEFYRLVRGRMKMPRGGATGGGSMQTMFEMPMMTEAIAESMFASWPKQTAESDPCWELSTMQQCATGLAFHQSEWAKEWGHANARPMFVSATEATSVLLASPPFTARLRKTTEKLNVLQVNFVLVLYTDTDAVVLPPDSTDPTTGQTTPFYADPPSQLGMHRDAFKAHAQTMVGELLMRKFMLSSGLAARAPAQYQQQLVAAEAAAEAAGIAEEQAAGMYRVEAIVQERSGKRKRKEYLVRWQGYAPEGDSWEPEKVVKDLDAFRDWKAAQAQEGSTSTQV